MSESSGFLSRWARRKAEHRQGREAARPPAGERSPQVPGAAERDALQPPPARPQVAAADATTDQPLVAGAACAEARTAPAVPASAAGDGAAPPELPPLGELTPESDFRPFMQAGVDPAARSAALRRLFADPRFNRMDGMDVYIDDYGKPDPIPHAVLAALNQARDLGLFRGDGDAADRPSADGASPPPLAAREPVAGASPPTPAAREPAGGAFPPTQAAQAPAAAAAPAGCEYTRRPGGRIESS